MDRIVTIITCTYKKFDAIYKTIDSVLTQDYPNIEYIISDDGSDNFPEEEIRNYIENNKGGNLKRYDVLHNKQNEGTVRNINGAYRHANGYYLAAIAGDDVYNGNDTISRLVNAFDAQEGNMMVSSRIVCSEDGKMMYMLPHLLHRGRLSRLTQKQQYGIFVSGQSHDMASGSVFFMKNPHCGADESFYDERYTLWEDGPCLERYLRSNKIGMAYEICSVLYTTGGISTIGRNPKLVADSLLYNSTDRIGNLDHVAPFYACLARYNSYMYAHDDTRDKMKFAIRHIFLYLYKVLYKFDARINCYIDKVYLNFFYRSHN